MIDVTDLVKTFHGARGSAPVLRGVSLRVEKGEIFGIIGRSGAGKSTLVRCVNMLELPTSGRVVVHGREMTALAGAPLREARRDIGMIFQHFNLLSSRTVLENVALPLELAGRPRERIHEEVLPLLELVGLTGHRDHHPAQLSGGQKQRVGIARALASRPSALLCDEATSALDPETTRSILRLLRDINRRLGLTILLITHEMAVVQEICDRVAVLERGRIVEQGSVFDLFTAPAHPVTRSFVRDAVERALPEWLAHRLRDAPADPAVTNPVLRIVFTGPSAETPVIAEVVRRFAVLLNILQGNIGYIQGRPYGNVVVEALGAPAAIDAACAYVRERGLRVEVLGRVAAVMVVASTVVSALVGVPLGILLVVTGPGHVMERPLLHRVLGLVVNVGRSVPFIILLVAIVPFTRLVVGTSIGTAAAIVPLSIAAIPFVGRVSEAALREVDRGLLDAAAAMGATPFQIVWKVLLPEARPGLVAGLTITVVTLVGYSAMAGAIGGGGLGDLGIRYGYQRFRPEVMLAVVVVLVLVVQAIQSAGDRLARRLDHRSARTERPPASDI